MNQDPGTVWFGDGFAAKLVLSYCRGFPQHRGKRRLGEAMAKTLLGGKVPIRSAAGARLRIDLTDWIGRTIAYQGGYEPKSISLAARLMAGGGSFVDVGCNFGLYTCAVGVVPRVRCISIDGSFTALTKLSDNLRLNPSVDSAVVNCALAGNNEMYCFDVPQDGNLGTTRVSQNESGRSASRFWVLGTRLDAVLKRVNAGPVKLLKIDVEGFEVSVFEGLDFDGPFRPANIIVECDPQGFANAGDCFAYLVRKDYAPRTVEGSPVENCRDLPEMNVWFSDRRARPTGA